MTTNLTMLANRLVNTWRKTPEIRFLTGEELRDRVDLATGGELDYQPLNILTDMVEDRLATIFAPLREAPAPKGEAY